MPQGIYARTLSLGWRSPPSPFPRNWGQRTLPPHKFSLIRRILHAIEKSASPLPGLETVRGGEAFERLGIADAVHRDHFFHSVDEAVRVLAKKTNEFPIDKE
jgi:hypothetical protein